MLKQISPLNFVLRNIIKSKVRELHKKKLLVGDMHVHSSFSDGLNNINELAIEAKQRDLDFIAITDHLAFLNSNDLKKYFYSCKYSSIKKGIVIVPGIEINSTDGHIVVLFPNYDMQDPLKLCNLPSSEIFKYIHPLGGMGILAHPHRTSDIEKKIFRLKYDIDGVELNSQIWLKKPTIAENLGIAEVSGSDSHSITGIGMAITSLPFDNYTGDILMSLINSIKLKKTRAHLTSKNEFLIGLNRIKWLNPFYIEVIMRNILTSLK